MERSRSKRFIRFKLHAVLNGVMKPLAVLPHPSRGVTHPFARGPTPCVLPAPLVTRSPLGGRLGHRGATVCSCHSRSVLLSLSLISYCACFIGEPVSQEGRFRKCPGSPRGLRRPLGVLDHVPFG